MTSAHKIREEALEGRRKQIWCAIDAMIGMVKDGTCKPDRTWSGAMRGMFDKLDEIDALTSVPPKEE